MKLPVIIDTDAQEEWNESALWYEKRERGVGIRFNIVVREYLEKIASDYARFPFATRLTQKAKMIGWPYSIYFVVNHSVQQIKVVAVWHGSQKPSKLRRRLG
jgi:hypothetical protein